MSSTVEHYCSYFSGTDIGVVEVDSDQNDNYSPVLTIYPPPNNALILFSVMISINSKSNESDSS